jgi:tetratricopeptide (TPR) repeat protein
LLAALGTATPARADTALDEAKALTNTAMVEYNVGKFREALELYSKAYERYPTPVLLFDVGQCQRMLKNYERAIFFFRGYLRAEPSAPNRTAVEALIAEAQRELDDERAIEAAKADQAPAAPASAASTEPPAPPSAAPPLGAPPPPTPPAAPKAELPAPPAKPAIAQTDDLLFKGGLVTAGAGVVAVGLGVYFGLHAASLSSEIASVSASRGMWTAQDQSDYDAGQTSATAASVLYVAGGLLLATGGVLVYFGWPRVSTTTALVVPEPGGASFAAVSRF